jgi:hypothetical protein
LATLLVLALFAAARPAWADLTAFLGVTPTPENRTLRGFSGGLGLLVVGFEFEYANTPESEDDPLPGLRTWSGNVLVQTPVDLSGVSSAARPGSAGRRLVDDSETNTAVNRGWRQDQARRPAPGAARLRMFNLRALRARPPVLRRRQSGF